MPRLLHAHDDQLNHDVYIPLHSVESFEYDRKNGLCTVNMPSGRQHLLKGQLGRRMMDALTEAHRDVPVADTAVAAVLPPVDPTSGQAAA